MDGIKSDLIALRLQRKTLAAQVVAIDRTINQLEQVLEKLALAGKGKPKAKKGGMGPAARKAHAARMKEVWALRKAKANGAAAATAAHAELATLKEEEIPF